MIRKKSGGFFFLGKNVRIAGKKGGGLPIMCSYILASYLYLFFISVFYITFLIYIIPPFFPFCFLLHVFPSFPPPTKSQCPTIPRPFCSKINFHLPPFLPRDIPPFPSSPSSPPGKKSGGGGGGARGPGGYGRRAYIGGPYIEGRI